MKIFEWRMPTDSETAKRRAGGRRRYNAERRKRVDRRRLAVAEAVAQIGWSALITRGWRAPLAAQLGVSASTVSRDLRYLLFGGTEYTFHDQYGEYVFSVVREYPGGKLLSVTDPEGNEIRGEERRRILKLVRRYPR